VGLSALLLKWGDSRHAEALAAKISRVLGASPDGVTLGPTATTETQLVSEHSVAGGGGGDDDSSGGGGSTSPSPSTASATSNTSDSRTGAVVQQLPQCRRVCIFVIDVIYHRPAYPALFQSILDIADRAAQLQGHPPATIQPNRVSELWAWSGTESDTEEEQEHHLPPAAVPPPPTTTTDATGADQPAAAAAAAAAAVTAAAPEANGGVSVVLGWHRRDEDKEDIVLHMCAQCPTLRLHGEVGIGSLYTVRVYSFLPGATSPHPVDLYRAACLACLE
jgi:hypothetical protein